VVPWNDWLPVNSILLLALPRLVAVNVIPLAPVINPEPPMKIFPPMPLEFGVLTIFTEPLAQSMFDKLLMVTSDPTAPLIVTVPPLAERKLVLVTVSPEPALALITTDCPCIEAEFVKVDVLMVSVPLAFMPLLIWKLPLVVTFMFLPFQKLVLLRLPVLLM
jgi:hypothetical protein